ncbi:hypothetical protein D3C87_1042800 [compost metagenome]
MTKIIEKMNTQQEEVLRVIDGPYGPIEFIAAKQETPSALADLHHVIADILVKQAIRKTKIKNKVQEG